MNASCIAERTGRNLPDWPCCASRGALAAPARGKADRRDAVLPCALGRSGVVRNKREGDGASPAGRWPLLYFYLRAPAPLRLPWRRTRPHDLWCDDPRAFLYNKPLRRRRASAMRKCGARTRSYDAVGVMGYNFVLACAVAAARFSFTSPPKIFPRPPAASHCAPATWRGFCRGWDARSRC